VAVIAVLAATFRVRTQTSFSTGSGAAGSAAYQQEIAFVRCMRSHGMPDLPDPPPGGSISVPKSSALASQAVDACKHLTPLGRENTTVKITL
jgi:hypothetical protein